MIGATIVIVVISAATLLLKKCHNFPQVMSKLVARTVPGKLVFIGEILGGGKDFKPKMDELVIDIIIVVIIVMVIFVREILGGGKDFKPNGRCYHQHPH